ncbi:MAG: four helix bundle protein [bacterium]|nr:four helix bundle protein [bacterium]
MENFRFLNWTIYTEAKNIFGKILIINNKLPNEIKFSLGDQPIRSSLSVVLNIAEGSGKNSDRELNRYFNIAIGSLYETLANLDILKDEKYISKEQYNSLFTQIESIIKQLGGFKKLLK